MSYSIENPWIKQREPIMCTWNALQNRGTFSNVQVSTKNDLMMFSERQIKQYVKMLKAFGFTGMQITDGCLSWRTYGSPEFVHGQIRRYAEALHEEGMNFTYWVWAACFDEFGWSDPEARYSAADGGRAYDDPQVFATFDRYYDMYAELADVTDLLMMHFADPGKLTSNDDIFAFARFLEDKFRAKNPNVRFAIETWGSADDFPDKLAAAGFRDHMLLELPFLPVWKEEGKRARFRRDVINAGCRLGSWGWYTCDMEIDQLAAFHVNNRVIADVYKKTREQADHVAVPEYWSELSAYNVLNFASMYSCAQLLIDPERSPDHMLREVTEMFFGKKYFDEVLRALELVRDARSGDTWESYWWTDEGFDLGTGDPESIIKRCEVSIEEITRVSRDHTSYASVPTPLEPCEIAELMIPHLEQIRLYARFRLDMAELEKKLDGGAPKEELYRELDRIWHPIPDFNTIIGVFGQLEANFQDKAVYGFCDRAGIEVPKKGYRDALIKRRFLDFMIYQQRAAGEERLRFSEDFYSGPFVYLRDARRILDIMTDEGVLQMNSDGTYSLLNYEDYRYNFN